MNRFGQAVSLLPVSYGSYVRQFEEEDVEELRLRLGQPPSLSIRGKERCLTLPKVQEADLIYVVEKASRASLYSVRAQLEEGYISYRGLRVGVCGAADLRDGRVGGFRSYGSVSIRIPGEYRGILDPLESQFRWENFQNTLILSPPGGGKTTALREMLRLMSESGIRMGVVDERNELSASDTEGQAFDLGPRTDVLVHVPKAQGAMILLRNMTPQVIAMDEITKPEDVKAVEILAGCGTGILASAHGTEVQALKRRRLYRELLDTGIFTRALIIKNSKGERRYCLEELT